ncbi:MAG TPA: alpha/beta hydrolase [Chitinophagaceae bacterium]|nr:alpha/beta hydrolase [Chitinophagaceae bacterium]
MKKWWVIVWMLFLTKLSFSQDSCLPRYELPVKHLLVAENIKMAYVEKGQCDAIIFIHGLGGNLSHWQKNISDLSANFHCIAVDLPGYGHSDKSFSTEKDQLQFYADALQTFIRKKNFKKVVLAGHSMGGQIATILALQHPQLISRVILLAPAGLETFTEAEAKMMMAATPPTIFEKQEEAVMRYNYKQNFYQQPTDAEVLIQDRLRLKNCGDFKQYTEAVSNSIKGMLDHPIRKDLSKLIQPVLILFGENDALIPNKLLHANLKREVLLSEISQEIKKNKIVIIPGVGHLLQFEKPGEINKEIKTFLQ